MPKQFITDFFYPKGAWAGYARFFDPSVSASVGTELSAYIYAAVAGDEASIDAAIRILNTSHMKTVTHEGHPFREVWCYPTSWAKKAVRLLSGLRMQLDHYLIARAENRAGAKVHDVSKWIWLYTTNVRYATDPNRTDRHIQCKERALRAEEQLRKFVATGEIEQA